MDAWLMVPVPSESGNLSCPLSEAATDRADGGERSCPLSLPGGCLPHPACPYGQLSPSEGNSEERRRDRCFRARGSECAGMMRTQSGNLDKDSEKGSINSDAPFLQWSIAISFFSHLGGEVLKGAPPGPRGSRRHDGQQLDEETNK